MKWDRIDQFVDGEGGVGAGGFDIPLRRRLSDRASKNERLNREQRSLLEHIDQEKAGLETPDQLALLKMIIGAIGDDRKTHQSELACELGVGRTTIERGFKFCRRLGVMDIEAKWDPEAGAKRSYCRTIWAKVKSFSNGQATAATNGTPKKRSAPKPSTNGAPKSIATPRPAKTVGRKNEWDDIVAFAETHIEKTGASYRETLTVFKEFNPEAIIPGDHNAMKAAIHYRRNTAAAKNQR